MFSEDIDILTKRFDKVVKIAKYDPICGEIWPNVCQYGMWNIEILLHSSDEYLDKILRMLDEMYGETMSVREDEQFSDIFLDFFGNKKNLVL